MDKETIVQLLSDGVISNEVAAKYFPELKEIEDEKVKEELIKAINLAYDCGIAITKENRDKYLAWIEKQGEQKPVVIIPKFRPGDVIHLKNSCAEYTIKSIFDGHYYGNGFSFNIVGCDRDYELVKQKPTNVCEGCNNVKGCVACVDGSEWAHIEEQNPAWSEEDKETFGYLEDMVSFCYRNQYVVNVQTCERIRQLVFRLKSLCFQSGWGKDDITRIDEIIETLNIVQANRVRTQRMHYNKSTIDRDIEWLKFLKDKVLLQPKQEWSEEDERNLQGIIDEIEVNKHSAPDYDLATYDRFLSFLKSLRPQSTWKPSDEQMGALANACDGKILNLDYLNSLYQDLKKLREDL